MPAPHFRLASASSSLECYESTRDPGTVVCYRLSYRTMHRDGEIVFVPFLIQVPTPSDPPPPQGGHHSSGDLNEQAHDGFQDRVRIDVPEASSAPTAAWM